MGFVSVLEDIEKRADGASPTPTTMIEVKGLPYHSDQARLIRNIEKKTSGKSSASRQRANLRKSKKKLSPTQKLRKENLDLRLEVADLERKIENLQKQLMKYTVTAVPETPRKTVLCLRNSIHSDNRALSEV